MVPGPKLLPRIMSGFIVLLQLGSAVMSMACVSKGVIGNSLYRVSPTFHWHWDGWPCPLLNTVAGKLAL